MLTNTVFAIQAKIYFYHLRMIADFALDLNFNIKITYKSNVSERESETFGKTLLHALPMHVSHLLHFLHQSCLLCKEI